MYKKKNYSLTLDESAVEDSKDLFEKLGLDLDTAVNVFLHACLINHGVPFKVRLRSDITPYTKSDDKEITHEASMEDYEIGNLMFGNSRGEYALEREEVQDLFVNMLGRMGFDSYGHIDSEILKKHEKNDSGQYIQYSQVDEETLQEVKLNGERFEASDEILYNYNGNTYEYEPEFESEDHEIEEEEKMFLISEATEDVTYFSNDIFEVRPYYWGDSPELAEKANFLYKPTGLKIKWYKYPLRDAYANQNITYKELEEILQKCLKSI